MKIFEALKFGYSLLKQNSIDTYMLDSQLLLCNVLNVDKLFIIMNRDLELKEEDEIKYKQFIELRKNKMPVKYIIKKVEFMGIEFFIERGVLIPRPDTEVLCEEAIDEIRKNNFKSICDVCCGSGAIGISMASFIKNVIVDCCDISDKAIEVTKKNIAKHELNDRVQVYKSNLLNFAVEGNKKFDAVISNPPYIKEDIIPTLMKDVKDYEPYEALNGGKDGLFFYREIVQQSKYVLNKNGSLFFEIGYDQKEEVTKMLEDNGFKDIKCKKDLSLNDRVIKASFY
ncbi:MAG: peptide chain release factor N(5)-glutamine methyltransferase [Clostridium sp.]|nr:peptide chain release factor N(5)-glutamine methyltransferase [Clostridium sp.]